MSPLKNTDHHLSDFLPAALVKDWRQCFRSRSTLLIFILLELAGWLMFYCMAPTSVESAEYYMIRVKYIGESLYLLGLFALVFAIPFRAGMTVAADTRVRSSNFLMLTPLSARSIVWGTWCSSVLMVLLAAVIALPLLGALQVLGSVSPGTTTINLELFDWGAFGQKTLVLAWLVLCGWVMAACYMFCAGLPRLLRLGILLACIAWVYSLMWSPHELAMMFDSVYSQGIGLPHLLPILLHITDAVLLIVLFLELARRHYAAPAENGSRSVRLLACLPWLLFALLAAGLSAGLTLHVDGDAQADFALLYLFGALLSDALLPTYAMPAHAWRLWRWLPGWVQKPGIVSSALCLALATPFFALPEVLNLLGPEWNTPHQLQLFLYQGTKALNFGFSLLFWLLMTDCLCRRSSVNRPVVFGLVAVVCSFVCMFLKLTLTGHPVAKSLLPLCGVEVPSSLCNSQLWDEAVLACALNGGTLLLTLLLLLFWRGRMKKG